ncbi:hypothetical protein FQN54_008049 [Arachnomyces sp. PD_36]|nr:hypothetical protein FQN54_008049 [Arachnomyces sp. PD_36]
MADTQTTPEVLWAQRSSSSEPEKNILFVSITVSDVPESAAKLDLKPTGVSFTGRSDTKKTTYHVDLELYGEIDVENCKSRHTSRGVDLVLRKKELKEEYWPRLLKDSKKVHFLKTDFDKWVDEDEQDEQPEDDAMGGMGGMGDMAGMGGMPGMGGMGGDGGMGGIDFSKLGGMPGMEGMGMGGMPGMEGLGAGAGEEGSDDEMPALEEDDDAAGKEGESKPKIEEVS